MNSFVDDNCQFVISNILNSNKNYTKEHIFDQLYKYLYGICDKNYFIRLINSINGYYGFCTNKWLHETVAIKCYDCEYDSTCAICLECFFHSDHTSHEYRLTRTSGGCCDCGDISSWNIKGSCKNHSNFYDYDERLTLTCFTNAFLIKLENILGQIIFYISEYLKNIHIIDEYSLHILILFLNDLVKVSPSYRYAMNLCISNDVLKDWILKHQILSSDIQKSFNSLYLTLLTSMSFKRKFSSLFSSLYIDIVQPLKEIQDEWHLSNLSVQLFTYSTIANELVVNSFLNYCIEPINDKNLIDKRLNTLQFSRFDRKKFRVISDITYLINHNSVCEFILSDTSTQNTLFNILLLHHNMNLIEREENEHVSYENSGYSISFTIEHTLHTAFKPLSDYFKSLTADKIPLLIGFYKNLNYFMSEHLLHSPMTTEKLARTFHIPLIRFFGYIIDYNLLRSTRIKRNKSEKSKGLNIGLYYEDIFDAFDTNILIYIIKKTIDVCKFSMEIKQNLWVYNGESMHDQRSNYYDLIFDSYDISAIQIAISLLSNKDLNNDIDILSIIFDHCFDFEHINSIINDQTKVINNEGENANDESKSVFTNIRTVISDIVNSFDPTSESFNMDPANDETNLSVSDLSDSDINALFTIHNKKDPGDYNFKISLFISLLNTILNDIKHLEILSIPMKTMMNDYVTRGLPLLKMEIINALTSGNAEFVKVVNETKKHWKHHPKLIETIENIASFNYSKISDKTYLRLKTESYKYIDILWNPQNSITHSICKKSLDLNISLLGSTEDNHMSPEYYETQNIILNSISSEQLLNYIVLFLSNLSKITLESDDICRNYNKQDEKAIIKFELVRKLINDSDIKFNQISDCILYCVKIINLFIDKLSLPNEDLAKVLIKCLDNIDKNVDDEIYKKCIKYTINKLKTLYSIDKSMQDESTNFVKKDVKSIQMQMLRRISSQNTFLSKLDGDNDLNSETNEDELICILCKQTIDPSSHMSYMAFVSTNNVLRRCSLSTNSSNYNYNIYSMSSLPLRSSIITTCGHIAHNQCISHHRKVQTDTHLFSMYGIQKSKDEFFCPVCKSLCNYTLNMITQSSSKDNSSRSPRLTHGEDVESSSEHPCESDQDGSDDEESELGVKMDMVSNWSWRYPYTTNWLPSPVYSSFEEYPLYVYGLRIFSHNLNMTYYLTSENKNVQDEHALSFNRTIPSINCLKCSLCELSTIEKNNCISFNDYNNQLIPKRKFKNVKRINMVDNVFKCFMDNIDDYMDKNIHHMIMVNSSQIEWSEFFPKLLTTTYAVTLFSKNRTYFGIQNWRHVNSTVKVDPKFWLLYNEILNVTSLRRNTLGLSNSLYSQLIRTFYFSQSIDHKNYSVFTTRNLLERNIELDETYHDTKDDFISLPDTSLYYDVSLSERTNFIRIFIESLGENELNNLYNVLNIYTNNCENDYDMDCEQYELFSQIFNSEYDTFNIKSLTPLKYHLNEQNPNVYKMLGNDLLINPWSCDFIREFLLYFLTSKEYGIDELKSHLYYYIMVATVQVMDRFIVELVQESYVEFINQMAQTDVKCLYSRNKRDFLIQFSSRYFKDFYESAEFPVDVNSRFCLIDFESHLKMFKQFNGYNSSPPSSQYYQESIHETFNEMVQEIISYCSFMKSIHDNHVEAFTEPIPDKLMDDYDNDDFDNYLINQVSRLVRVREIHNNLNNTYDLERIIKTLKNMTSEEVNAKRPRLGSVDKSPNVLDQIFVNPNIEEVENNNTEFFYKGVDLARRLNKMLYKNHSNIAFFETLKHNIPESIHILDVLDDEFFTQLSFLSLHKAESFISLVEILFNFVIGYIKNKGYLSKTLVIEFSKFESLLYESLNLFLDVTFWTIDSVFPFDADLRSKLLYSNLYDKKKRFETLFTAHGLIDLCNVGLTYEIVQMLFSKSYKNQLKLNRICNMEVTPPIISNYNLIKIDKFLDEINWDIIRSTTFRNCANCGLKPANPMICLLCGCVLCSNSECCQKVKISDLTRFISEIDKKSSEFKKSDVSKIYHDEIYAHSNVCGGGQGVYFSPYYCFVLYVDERRRCVVPSLYSDKYGNSDLHGKVYGTVRLSNMRIEGIVNTLCSGRLSNEIVSQRKQMLNNLN